MRAVTRPRLRGVVKAGPMPDDRVNRITLGTNEMAKVPAASAFAK